MKAETESGRGRGETPPAAEAVLRARKPRIRDEERKWTIVCYRDIGPDELARSRSCTFR